VDGEGGVGDEVMLIDGVTEAEALAVGAGALGRVEGEELRGGGIEAEAAVGAGVTRGEDDVIHLIGSEDDGAVGAFESGFDGFGDAIPGGVADFDAIDDEVDGVFDLAFEGEGFGEGEDLPIDANAEETGACEFGEEVLVFAFLFADEGSEDEELGSEGEFESAGDDLIA
jgi:hypothetical protein